MMIDPQETFDTVARHLFKQGKQAIRQPPKQETEKGICLYRGPNGTKCAAGCLIPDSEYKASFEGCGIAAIRQSCKSLMQHQGHLVQDLQNAHDRSRGEGFWNQCKGRLIEVAVMHDLNTDCLRTLGVMS